MTGSHHQERVEGPIFIGRSWQEYLKMFDLDLEEIYRYSILDCAAGASSFTAHMNSLGFDAVAADILYGEDPDVLEGKCAKHLDSLIYSIKKVGHIFVWNFFPSVDELKKQRMVAGVEFVEDYKNHRKRYVEADLTKLPFKDSSFQMVLCSHLLFIYDHRLDYEFHMNSIGEMLRVSSKELRIYPIVKNKGKRSEFVDKLICDFDDCDIEIVSVDYEFRKNGNEMIRILK